MDERLKGLKKAMKATTFKNVAFTEQHQQTVHQKIDKELMLIDLFSLLTTPKTGPYLTEQLHQKGVAAIVLNEGIVYTMLHQAELDGYVTSQWHDIEKYYELTKKGYKLVQKEHTSKLARNLLRSRLQEVTFNG